MRDCKKYEIALPYPEVEGGPEPKTVALLMQDYAGVDSEMTAISQYIYQHMILEEKEQDVADTLECIAITEMRHKELLGEAIITLGGNPIYAANNTFWCARYVNYAKNLREILLVDLQSEYTAICNYRRHIRMIGNKSVKALLERIVMDEEHHVQIFNELLAKHG